MELWIKITLVALIGFFVYREILKSAAEHSDQVALPAKRKAGFLSLLMVGTAVGIFVYAGMSMTLIETRDLRPYRPAHSPQMVSIFDKGVIELNGMVIKTNLARKGELAGLAGQLTRHCGGNDGCEIQAMFDYVTHIPYKTDYSSRNAKAVVATQWGDCDDKSNLFASLLNERGFDYRFVYVPHHVFVIVHIDDTKSLRFLPAKLVIDSKNYYYAETTATGASIGEFNGQFPFQFEGVYDMNKNEAVDPKKIAFRIG